MKIGQKNKNLKKNLKNYFEKYSNNIFLVDHNGRQFTYNEFFKNTLRLIKSLKNKGIKKNSRILLKGNNCTNYLVTLYACLLGGYVVCPVDPSIKPEKLEKLIDLYKINHTIEDAKEIDYENLEADEELIDYENSDCLIIGSSGTTGEPKGILFTSDSILLSAESFSNLANYNDKTKILHCLPMFYMGGILDTFFACMFSGSKIILGERFSISNVLKFWELPIKHDCNTLFLTPSIVAFICAIYKKPDIKIKEHVSKYKSIIATGSFLYPEVRKNFYKIFNKKIFSCYGATELVGPLALQGEKDTFENYCVGKHGKGIEILIKKDEEGLNIIMVKSPFFMKGYITDKGFELPKTYNGYYNTGDLGNYENNLLFVNGRKREIIKKGGELIFLSVIENAALQNKNVLEAAALGKKDIIAGEEPYLIVVFKENSSPSNNIENLGIFLRERLRPIEVPKKIIISSKLSKTKSGKIIKKSLYKLLED